MADHAGCGRRRTRSSTRRHRNDALIDDFPPHRVDGTTGPLRSAARACPRAAVSKGSASRVRSTDRLFALARPRTSRQLVASSPLAADAQPGQRKREGRRGRPGRRPQTTPGAGVGANSEGAELASGRSNMTSAVFLPSRPPCAQPRRPGPLVGYDPEDEQHPPPLRLWFIGIPPGHTRDSAT